MQQFSPAQRFLVGVFFRFFSLCLLLAVPFVVHGGKLGILLNTAPTALAYSLIGFGYLISSKRRPKDFANPDQIKDFRMQSARMMWSLNLVLLFSGLIISTSHWGEETEALGAVIAGTMSGVLMNTIFYISVWLTPVQAMQSLNGELVEKARSIKTYYNFVIMSLGYFGLIVVFVLMGSELNRILEKPYSKTPEGRAWELAEEKLDQEKQSYAKSKCALMPERVAQDRRSKLYSESLKEISQKALDYKKPKIERVTE